MALIEDSLQWFGSSMRIFEHLSVRLRRSTNRRTDACAQESVAEVRYDLPVPLIVSTSELLQGDLL